jgi:long-subunit fatty acid transport protein
MVRSYRFEKATLAYFKITFQYSRKDSENYKENLVTDDSNPIDIQTLNLTNACPVLSVQEVIQRAVILKLNGMKDIGRLDRRHHS